MKKVSIFTFIMLLAIGLMSVFATEEVHPVKIITNETSAILIYSLKKPASIQFFYDTKYDKWANSRISVNPKRNIEIMADGLMPGSLYYYRANFYDTNNTRLYYEIGHFITKGRSKTEMGKIEIIPDKYSATIKIYTTNPITGNIEVKKGRKHITTAKIQKGTKTVLLLKGDAQLPVYLHSVKIEHLKPLTKYKINIKGGDENNVSVQETQDFTTRENNIALNKSVEGTFNGTFIADKFRLEGDILSRVTDGSMSYRNGMAVSHDPDKSDQWVIIDLGKSYPITDVIVYWRALAYPLIYQIGLSNDKKQWKTKNVRVKSKKVMIEHMPTKIVRTKLHGQSFRYLKIFIAKKNPYFKKFASYNFLQLMEVKVYKAE